jgi:hypothetical protein
MLRDPLSQEHQSTIIGGLLFPSINNHRWFNFSIYAIETHDFNSSSSSLHPLYLHDLIQQGGVMKSKVASKAIPLETPASVKQSIKTFIV